MSIAAASSVAASSSLRFQVGIEVQKKSQDHAEQQGEAALKLLDAAAAIATSAPDGSGGSIDVYA